MKCDDDQMVQIELIFNVKCFIGLYSQIYVALLSALLAKHIHNYWASKASPTLGCSIEISRDIYMYECLSMGNP